MYQKRAAPWQWGIWMTERWTDSPVVCFVLSSSEQDKHGSSRSQLSSKAGKQGATRQIFLFASVSWQEKSHLSQVTHLADFLLQKYVTGLALALREVREMSVDFHLGKEKGVGNGSRVTMVTMSYNSYLEFGERSSDLKWRKLYVYR